MPEGFDVLFAMQCTIHGWGEGNVRTTRSHRVFRLHPQRLARIVRCVAMPTTGSELRALLQSATAFAASHLSQTACCVLGPLGDLATLRATYRGRAAKIPVTTACITRCASRCEYVVSHDVPECRDAIPPPDLLPFGVRPTRIRNRHLENAHVRTGEPRRHLGLEPEAIRR